VATTFEWTGTGHKTGVQTIDGKEIQHPKMWKNLQDAKGTAKNARFVRGVIAGRVEVPRQDWRGRNNDEK
jgi:hypothetical protein